MANPPHWFAVDPLVGQYGPFFYGFSPTATAAGVNRFRARYRLASAFRGLELDDYQDETRDGYSALASVALWWSAIELLTGLCDVPGPGRLVPGDGAQYIDDIRAIPNSVRYIGAAKPHLTDQRLRDEISSFEAGRLCAPLALARTIRHIFLHGSLTPGAGGIDDGGATAVAICTRSVIYLRNVIDHAWTDRLRNSPAFRNGVLVI